MTFEYKYILDGICNNQRASSKNKGSIRKNVDFSQYNEMILFIIVTSMLILNVKIGENEYGV